MNGCCDVPGCGAETFMGWRPLNQPLGRQICAPHFSRHKNPADSFNLGDVFGFKRPVKMVRATPRAKGTRPSKIHGAHMELPPSDVPTDADRGITKRESSLHEKAEAKKRQAAAGPKEGRGKKSGGGNLPQALGKTRGTVAAAVGWSGKTYEKAKAEPAKPVPPGISTTNTPSGCWACGAQRELGHTYCERCARERGKITRRQAQSRYRKKQHTSYGPE